MDIKQTFSRPIIIESEKIENLPRLLEVLYAIVNRLPLSEGIKRDVVKLMLCDILQNEPMILEQYLSSKEQ